MAQCVPSWRVVPPLSRAGAHLLGSIATARGPKDARRSWCRPPRPVLQASGCPQVGRPCVGTWQDPHVVGERGPMVAGDVARHVRVGLSKDIHESQCFGVGSVPGPQSSRGVSGHAGASSRRAMVSRWPAQADGTKVHSTGLGGREGHDDGTEAEAGQRHGVGHEVTDPRLSMPWREWPPSHPDGGSQCRGYEGLRHG